MPKSPDDAPSVATLDFLAGGGEMGERIRAFDWQACALGEPAEWPQALRTSLRLLLTTNHPVFIFWGPDLVCFYNDAYRASIGPEKHPAMLGASGRSMWKEIWHIIGPQIDQVMSGGGPTWHQNHLVPIIRNGRLDEVYWTYSYSPIDHEGGIGGVLVLCNETTEQVLSEQRYERERDVLATIVETTDAFVQVADLDYRWLAINKASADEFERIFGVRPKVGDSMLDILDHLPDHRAAVQAVWSRALAGEEFTEVGMFGDAGRAQRHYEMKFNTLRDREGRRIGAFQFVYDVTKRVEDERRLLETREALRQAQKMEAVGQLTGGIAHDFNNLLMAISGGLKLLDRPLDPAATARVKEGMQRAVERGASLTRQLMAFSRRKPLEPETLDVGARLWAMRELLDRALRGDVQVEMRLPVGVHAIEADAGELELAILNLCVNACDAMPAGGVIQIEVRSGTAPDGDIPHEIVCIDVRDSGVGMDEETQARVFEPFFTTKEVGKGSGLGLAQVYAFMQQSGGDVTIKSALGQGTTVSLNFPRSSKRPRETATAAKKATATNPGRSVLIVEDDADVAAMTSNLLAQLGHSVRVASSAAAALSLLEQGMHFDAVVSDVMMPGGSNGVDLAKTIKARWPDLPVVLVTGHGESVRGLDDDGVPVLLKPYEIDELDYQIANAMKRGSNLN